LLANDKDIKFGWNESPSKLAIPHEYNDKTRNNGSNGILADFSGLRAKFRQTTDSGRDSVAPAESHFPEMSIYLAECDPTMQLNRSSSFRKSFVPEPLSFV
jgi:hypothetical protein